MADTRVVFIGAGNVAWSLAPAVQRAEGYVVTAICSRTLDSARQLAARVGSDCLPSTFTDVCPPDDIYIISVRDDAIGAALDFIGHTDALVLHTSGGVPMEALARVSKNYGVLYPLQTFTKGLEVKLDAVPFFVEASNVRAFGETNCLAKALSHKVIPSDSDSRRRMHVAAVFACNFVNFMLTNSNDLLEADGLDIKAFKPLIEETLRKAYTLGPESGQTGPARRGDTKVMEAHEASIADPSRRELYRYISQLITERYNNEQD